MKRALFVLAFILCAVPGMVGMRAIQSRETLAPGTRAIALINPATTSKILFLPVFRTGATYYIDPTSGSNSYLGTAKTHTTGSTGPWQHVPGSGGVTGTPASYTPQPDDIFIFKGGETYLVTVVGGINLTHAGTSGHPITYTTDHTWYTGSSWSKPVFDSQHMYPLFLIINTGADYIVLNDLEFKGAQDDSADGNGGNPQGSCLINGYGTFHNRLTNLYVHDWRQGGSRVSDGVHGGICFFYDAVQSTGEGDNIVQYSTITNEENASGSNQSGVAMHQVAYVWDNYIHDISSIGIRFVDVRRNRVNNINYPVPTWDHAFHINAFYMDPNAVAVTEVIADGNVMSNANYGIPGFIYCLANSDTSHKCTITNNVLSGTISTGEGMIAVDPFVCSICTHQNGGVANIYNNLFYMESSGDSAGAPAVHVVDRTSSGYKLDTFTLKNNYCIGSGYTLDDASSGNVSGTITRATNIPSSGACQSNSTATSQGYIQDRLWRPINGSGSTIGAGTDLSGVFTTDLNGLTRTTWDIGPYILGTHHEYYVSKTGSDYGNGSSASPFQTIRKCAGGSVSVAVAGDTCEVYVGTYNEAIGCEYLATGCHQGSSFTNAITVKGHSGDTVTVTCTLCVDVMGWGAVAIYPTHKDFYWIVQDLILDAGHDKDYGIAGLFADHIRLVRIEEKNSTRQGALPEGDDWEVLQSSFHDNGTDGQDHGFYWSGKRLLLDGGSYYNNQGLGIHIFDNGGNATDDNVIRNARIYNNGLSAGGGGIILATGAGNLAYNNLIYNNGVVGLWIDYRCGLYGAPCGGYGNTIYNNSGYGVVVGFNDSGATLGAILKNNSIYGNSGGTILDSGTSTVASNNVTSNPSFTNAGSGDFTLQSGSSARAANGFSGANLSSICTGVNLALCSDFAGAARGTTPDGGAYQYAAGTPSSISSISPDNGIQGALVAIAVTGASTNFSNGVSVCSMSGSDIVIVGTVVSSATAAVCTITIGANAATGLRNITITTGGEVAAATAAFNVTLSNSRQFQLFRIH